MYTYKPIFILSMFLTLSTVRLQICCATLTNTGPIKEGHVPNWVVPQNNDNPFYDVTDWVSRLNLQTCAIVEIGEDFCAMFVEVLPSTMAPVGVTLGPIKAQEYFLGVAECSCIRGWPLCSPALTRLRKDDCSFKEATEFPSSSARVHRRLCDVTGLSEWTNQCNCTGHQLAGQTLNEVQATLCSPRGVCGVARCKADTVQGRIHTVQCHSHCHGKQPFCEDIGPETSAPRRLTSVWTGWSTPKCNTTCGSGVLLSEATCLDRNSGKPAMDCLGPGTMCCTPEMGDCTCSVSVRNECSVVTRTSTKCVEKRGCPQEGDEKKSIDKNLKRSENSEPNSFRAFMQRIFHSGDNVTFSTSETAPTESATPSKATATPAAGEAKSNTTGTRNTADKVEKDETKPRTPSQVNMSATARQFSKTPTVSAAAEPDRNLTDFISVESSTNKEPATEHTPAITITTPYTAFVQEKEVVSPVKTVPVVIQEPQVEYDEPQNVQQLHQKLQKQQELLGRVPSRLDALPHSSIVDAHNSKVTSVPSLYSAVQSLATTTNRLPFLWKLPVEQSLPGPLKRNVDMYDDYDFQENRDIAKILGLIKEKTTPKAKTSRDLTNLRPEKRRLLSNIYYPRDEFSEIETEGSEFDYRHQEQIENFLVDAMADGDDD